jgi:hypothetical protein
VTVPEREQKLRTLLERLGSRYADADAGPPEGAQPDGVDGALYQFVYSMLLWETTTTKATVALRRIHQQLVDYNELRICLPAETVEIIGRRYPQAHERSLRLHAALNGIFLREHLLRLDHLHEYTKRDARAYMDSLEGVPPFVSARVLLLSLGGHAFPVDQRILDRLIDAGAVPEKSDVSSAMSWLERKIHAGDAAPAYAKIQAWSERRKGSALSRSHGGGARETPAPTEHAESTGSREARVKSGSPADARAEP